MTAAAARGYEAASFGRAFFGQHESGDRALVFDRGAAVRAVLLDVAGHGPKAAAVAAQAAALPALAEAPDADAAVRALHEALRRTQGAAAVVADLDLAAATLTCVVVGSVLGGLVGATTSWFEPQPGLLGHALPNLREVVLPVRRGDVLVAASDGVGRRCLEALPRSAYLAPAAALAAMVVDRCGRTHDDSTCLVISVTP